MRRRAGVGVVGAGATMLVAGALAGCDSRAERNAAKPPVSTPAGERGSSSASPRTSENEVAIATPYYSLVAPAGVRADAELLARTLDGAIAKMTTDYADVDAERLLRSASVRVRIATTPDERCGVGHATNVSSWDDGRCTAEIHVLAPSAHPDPAAPGAPRTSTDEPMDAAYVQRVLVHEYATVLLESICRAKGGGWSFWEAPAWFVQGSEEYLGATYSTEHARTQTMRRCRDRTRREGLVTGDWGLDARSPYVSGPVLVEFIHERFGRDAFVAVLRSTRPTFGSAMREVLGLSSEEFHADFERWLGEDR